MVSKPESPEPRRSAKDERAERLAAELRANLRRRKEQVRGRDGAAEPPSDDAPRDEG